MQLAQALTRAVDVFRAAFEGEVSRHMGGLSFKTAWGFEVRLEVSRSSWRGSTGTSSFEQSMAAARLVLLNSSFDLPHKAKPQISGSVRNPFSSGLNTHEHLH